MNKVISSVLILLFAAACKGPGTGPLVKDPFKKPGNGRTISDPHSNSNVTTHKIDVKIEPCKDCIKISDLLENRNTYSGKTIKVTGRVTKFNPQIMGKNWIHIQDGTEFKGAFDLTITTDQRVSIGDTITFEGKIILDKDFGYGYYYNVLMEGGRPI